VLSPSGLAELSPLVRRAATLDPGGLVRIRVTPAGVSALVKLPFDVLVGRRIAGEFGAPIDATYAVAELLAWLDDADGPELIDLGVAWRTGLPPNTGWQRVEIVPDDVVRGLIRQGAATLREAAEREGLPGAQPRAEVADVLLDTTVLTVTDAGTEVEVSLRLISALVRMGFLARDSHLAVDVAGRWLRLAASYGSAYAERPGFGLGLMQPHSGVGR
jgi:hypothetical protein